MSALKKELVVSSTNSLNGYFPVRTNNKDYSFDWEVAQGIVVRNLYKKTVAQNLINIIEDGNGNKVDKTLDNFCELCRDDFEKRLDETELWTYLRKMYFSNGAFYEIAPESLLFKIASLSTTSSKNRLGDLFSSLMGGFYIENPVRFQRNFLEQQVVDSLRDSRVLVDFDHKRISKGINEKPYLPFLTDFFRKDVKFLADRPKYLLRKLEDLLKLYAYLYTAQLALNIKGWTSLTEPTSKPLYFIMENETASKERTDLRENGHQKVSPLLKNIFPYLTVSESLQEPDPKTNIHRMPLWMLASTLTEEDSPALARYAEEFARDRDKDPLYQFPYDKTNLDPKYWLKALLELSLKQFDKGETRASAQGKFIKATEEELCSTFVKSRGQVGRVLVMNQDFLELITNLAIGENEKLRFHELLKEFQARGIYFDMQTQQLLIQFYERVGNVERMSDSGDAVYVRKTV